jgi:hypothetical protein
MILSKSVKDTISYYLRIFLIENLFKCKIHGRCNRNQDHNARGKYKAIEMLVGYQT